jgi:hypothetical protein
MLLPTCAVDGPLYSVVLLLLAGIGNGAETCVSEFESSVALVTCAKADNERKSVRTILWPTKNDPIVSMRWNERKKRGCSEVFDLGTVFYNVHYSQKYHRNYITPCSFMASGSSSNTA